MALEIKRLHLASLRGLDGRDWPVHGFVISHPGGLCWSTPGSAARRRFSTTGGW